MHYSPARCTFVRFSELPRSFYLQCASLPSDTEEVLSLSVCLLKSVLTACSSFESTHMHSTTAILYATKGSVLKPRRYKYSMAWDQLSPKLG